MYALFVMQNTPNGLGNAQVAWSGIVLNILSPKSHELNTATSLNLAALSTQPIVRICTSIKEFNYVTGGGLVPGSVILIGGEPGIGKSTLLLQLCDSLPASTNKPLYISGEEAASQVALRAARLKIDVSKFNAAFGTDLEQIYALLQSVIQIWLLLIQFKLCTISNQMLELEQRAKFEHAQHF